MKSVLDELREMFGDKVIDEGLADGSIVAYDTLEPAPNYPLACELEPPRPGDDEPPMHPYPKSQETK